MTTKLLIVRPHGQRIRGRVLAFLAGVGVDTHDPVVLPPGVSDDAVLDVVHARPFGALLIPIHAHRGDDGELLNGLSLAQRIDAESQQVHAPIFMPATPFGMSTLELAMARHAEDGGPSERLRARLIPLPVDFLEAPNLAREVASRLLALQA